MEKPSDAHRRSWRARARDTFDDARASGWFWPGVALAVLVFGPFLLHPPTAWMLKNITFPTVLAALLMALAASGNRIGWCFVIPLIAAPWMVWKTIQASHYMRLMPPELGITGIIELGVEEDILSGCGMLLFGLDASTAKTLRAAGPGMLPNHHTRASQFGEWKPTPVPRNDDQLWRPGLGCGRAQGKSREIAEAMGREGGFYAEQRRSMVMVFPESRIAAFVFQDR